MIVPILAANRGDDAAASGPGVVAAEEAMAVMSGTDQGDWPDLAGRILGDAHGRHHVLPVRVYYEDTDFSGLVYHASYLRWCERGRSDFLRLLGIRHDALLAGEGGGTPAAFVVRRMAIEYLKPARIDDVLEVVTRPGAASKVTFELLQQIRRGSTILFTANVTVVLVGLDGRPQRLGRIGQAFQHPAAPD